MIRGINMSTDNVFRSQVTPEETTEETPSGTTPTSTGDITKPEVPYLDYEMEHHKPYIVDYYDLGEFWNKDKTYTYEVREIDDYITKKIKSGEVDKSLKAVKYYLRNMDVVVGIQPWDSKAVKIERILNYIETMEGGENGD